LLKGPLFTPAVIGMFDVPSKEHREVVIDQAVSMFLAAYGPRDQG
jgi:hypothetical protein